MIQSFIASAQKLFSTSSPSQSAHFEKIQQLQKEDYQAVAGGPQIINNPPV